VDLIRQLLAVGFVFALLGAALLVLRRSGAATFLMRPKRGGEGRELQVVERLALTPHHSLHLVRVKGREILVSVSPSGCSILDKETVRG
jgi:flagellar biogenesis protein FliO